MHPSRQRGRDPQQKCLLPARTAVSWQAMCHPPEDLSAAAATDRSGSISSLIADLAHVCSALSSAAARLPSGAPIASLLLHLCLKAQPRRCSQPVSGSRPRSAIRDPSSKDLIADVTAHSANSSRGGDARARRGRQGSSADSRRATRVGERISLPGPILSCVAGPDRAAWCTDPQNSPTGRRGPIVVPSNQPHSAWRHCDVWRASGP